MIPAVTTKKPKKDVVGRLSMMLRRTIQGGWNVLKYGKVKKRPPKRKRILREPPK